MKLSIKRISIIVRSALIGALISLTLFDSVFLIGRSGLLSSFQNHKLELLFFWPYDILHAVFDGWNSLVMTALLNFLCYSLLAYVFYRRGGGQVLHPRKRAAQQALATDRNQHGL